MSKGVFTAALCLAALTTVACNDAPTAPAPDATRKALKLDGARKLMECDPTSIICDTSGGGGGDVISVDNRIYLHGFLVTNCDPSLDYRCSTYCDPYDTNCIQQTVDDGYYEIRQNLYEANGTWIGYNKQRWHGYSGVVDIPIFDTRMCAASGRYMNVEIYEIDVFNTAVRKASFNVYPGDRDKTLLEGNLNWVAHIGWHWDAC